jgi:AcrR family transcriptional regulator
MDMRDQILELAQKQMTKGGYDTLSFGVIAKDLDTTRANLHYHFKNKESLGIEVTKRFMADEFAEVKKLAAAHPADFSKQLIALEDHFWQFAIEENSASGCIACQIVSSPSSPEVLVKLANDFFEERFKFTVQQVQESQEAGNIRKDISAIAIATQSVAIMMGLMQMAQGFESLKDAENSLKGNLKEWTKLLKA